MMPPSPEKKPVHVVFVTPHPLEVYEPVAVNELPFSVPEPPPNVPERVPEIVSAEKLIAFPVCVAVVLPVTGRAATPAPVIVIVPLNAPL